MTTNDHDEPKKKTPCTCFLKIKECYCIKEEPKEIQHEGHTYILKD